MFKYISNKYKTLGLSVLLLSLVVLVILSYSTYLYFDQKCQNIDSTGLYIKPGDRDTTIEQAINNEPVKIHQHFTEEWSLANFQFKPLKKWQFWQWPIKGVVVKQVVTLQPTLEKPDGSKELIPSSFASYEYQIKTLGKKGTSINFEDGLGRYLNTNKHEVTKTLISQGYTIDNIDLYLQADNLRNLARLVGSDQVDQWLIESLAVVANKSNRTIGWQNLKTKQTSNIKNEVWQACPRLETSQ